MHDNFVPTSRSSVTKKQISSSSSSPSPHSKNNQNQITRSRNHPKKLEMEIAENWGRENVISQLNEGIKLTNKLKEQLQQYSNSSNCELLIEKIVSCYDNALAVLSYMDSIPTCNYVGFNPTTDQVSDQDKDHHVFAADHVPKKRKSLARWREQVHVCSETGYEYGYNWRKYGQKDILGATNPRCYYRCTYRHSQGCLATKQVQRGEDDRRILNIVYGGTHSCVIQRKKEINDETPQLENVSAALPLVWSEPTTSESCFSMPTNFNMDQSFPDSERLFALENFDFMIDFDAPLSEVSDYSSHVQHSLDMSKM